jgi:hypothetical protein
MAFAAIDAEICVLANVNVVRVPVAETDDARAALSPPENLATVDADTDSAA